MIPVSQSFVESPPSGQKTRQVWTPVEDQLLARAVQLETPKTGSISWCSVAAHLPGRNNKDCRKRWHYSIAHGHTIRKGTWTREEDQRLRDAVVIHGTRWSKIAQVVGTRNGDQCWKRWYDCLDPQIDKSPWTPEEDEKLVRMVTKHGRNWTGIVNKHFPKRTSLSAKNRYSILQRKQEHRASSQGASPPPSSRSGYSHARNISSASGESTATTMTESGVAYNMMAMSMESDYPTNQLAPQISNSYWSSSGLTSSTSMPSAPSSPDSTHADFLDWSAWGGVDSSDPSCTAVSAPYHLDATTSTSSYLSPSSAIMSMHSPQPAYDTMSGAGVNGYYNSVHHNYHNLSATTSASSPSAVSYSSDAAYSTGIPDENSQYMMTSYRTW
ncbi:hypothetical protein QBC37DRAFT_164731 [Rhypophila decipiens]|uniref:Uncharacterized protein n=1 Tax=Rhypophila decipiens TaxID=261697 RepID=A0AAN6YLK3_9PEZI|nr:hypothetical protein QBC37DRAFT_164731 [Rhypophila decipiens]